MDSRPCVTRPAEWWDTGDDGNRFAMMLCRLACPLAARAQCRAEETRPYGVVRDGVAWSDSGHPLPQCACGRPIVYTGWAPKRVNVLCRTCRIPNIKIMSKREYWRRHAQTRRDQAA